MSIGANIKARRLQLQMTQKELAEKVMVDQSMICQIERGTKVPTLPLSLEIANVLSCDVKDFATEPAESLWVWERSQEKTCGY